MTGILVGGPYDGATLPPASRPVFVWVGGSAKKPKGYSKPAGSRQLYRSQRREAKTEVFLFAGHTHSLCPSCGGYNERAATCRICGAAIRSVVPS